MIGFVTKTDVTSSWVYTADDGFYDDVLFALFQWALIAICYHSLVVILTGGMDTLIQNGFCWFKITCATKGCSKKSMGCRTSRYYKCQKRALRRKRRTDGSTPCFIHSTLSKLILPAPLPYRRRRQNDFSVEDEQVDDQTEQVLLEVVTSTTLGDSQSSIEPINPTDSDISTDQCVIYNKTCKKRRKRRSSVTQVSLMDLARMQRWDLMLQRIAQDKREARYEDADGLLPLHWAASGGPPVEVIDALLKAYSKGATAVDSEGSTVLHFACHYGANAEVVQRLCEFGDAISMQDKHGRTPLYHAVDKRANLDVLRTLVQADPSMITKPCLPKEGSLAKKIRARDGRPLEHRTPLFMAWAQVLMDAPSRNKRTGRLWSKAELLLEAAYAYHSSQKIYRMIHATVAFDIYLPSQILNFALELFPEQLTEREEHTGRVPLAVAAATYQLTMQRSQEVIQTLLKANPTAARFVDAQGRAPLALAVANGKAWTAGVQDLFHAAPDAIQQRDGLSKMYPSLLAASSSPAGETDGNMQATTLYSAFTLRQDSKTKDWDTHQRTVETKEELCAWRKTDVESRHISTVYELLRADPQIMK